MSWSNNIVFIDDDLEGKTVRITIEVLNEN